MCIVVYTPFSLGSILLVTVCWYSQLILDFVHRFSFFRGGSLGFVLRSGNAYD